MRFPTLRQWARLALSLFAITLASCATSMSTGEKFSPASADALIVFATSSDASASANFAFSTYDPEARRATATSFKGHYTIDHQYGSKVLYNVLRVPAGDYILKYVSTYNQIIFLKQGSVSFRVDPGQVAYLGAFRWNGRTVVQANGDIELAKARLAEYPNVTGNLEPITLVPATFE